MQIDIVTLSLKEACISQNKSGNIQAPRSKLQGIFYGALIARELIEVLRYYKQGDR